jgi:hypothetical protein
LSELHKTSSSVSTHTSFGTVRIEIYHPGYSFSHLEQYQAIGTDSQPSVAHLRHLAFRELEVQMPVIDKHEIVSCSVVFAKWN